MYKDERKKDREATAMLKINSVVEGYLTVAKHFSFQNGFDTWYKCTATCGHHFNKYHTGNKELLNKFL